MFIPKQIRFLQILAMAAVGGAALMALLWLVIPRTYTSSASILFPGTSRVAAPSGFGEQGPPTTGGAAGTGGGSIDQPSLPLMQGLLSVPQPGTSPSTAGIILKSRKTITRLIDKFDLAKEWGLSNERAIERFTEDFVCSEGLSGDLRIGYTDYKPERARSIVAEAIDVLTQSVKELSVDPADKNLALLQKSLDTAQKDCADAQKELVDFQTAVGGAPPDTQLTSLSQIYSDTLRDLYTAKVESATAESNARSVSDQAAKMIALSQDPTGSEKSMISVLYSRMVDAETQLSNLRRKYTDKRPEVVAAKQALDVATRDIKAEVSRQLMSVKAGASPFVKDSILAAVTAKAKEEGLRGAEQQIRERLQTLPATQAKYTQLQLNLRDERSRLTLIRGEYVKAQLIAQSRGPQFVVVDPPILPQRANRMEIWWWTFFGSIPGLVALFVTLFYILLKRSMKSLGF